MNKKPLIIAIVGMAGAGKSSVCDFFKEKGFTILRFGDQTDIGLKELNLSLNEKNEKNYRESLRKKLGMAAYAIKIKPRIEKALKENNQIILDGLYSWEEYVYLEKGFPGLILLCIYTRLQKRYKRLALRKIRGLTQKQVRERDIAELTHLNKGGPIALADYLIKNSASIGQLHKKLDKFLKLL